MTLSQRVMLTLAAPIILILGFALWFWPAMNDVGAAVRQVREEQLVASNMARDMTESVIQVQQFLSDISATQGKDGLDDGFARAEEANQNFQATADRFKKLPGNINDAAFQQRIDDLVARFADYFAMGNKMAHAYIDGGTAAGNAVMGTFDKTSEALQDKLKPFVEEQIAEASIHLKETEDLASRARMVALSVILVILAACSALGWSLVRYLKAQLGGEPTDAAAAAERIAQGDLSSNIPVSTGDQHSMMASMRSMQQSLASLVADISRVVAAAEAGDLGQRVDTSRSQGFARDIGNSLNELMETADTSLNDIARVASALAAGDLSQRISKAYPGTFGQTAEAVNATVSGLDVAIDNVRRVVQAASESDYSVRMETRAEQGYIHTLGELLNRLTSVTEQALVDIQQVASALAEGDLNRQVQGHYPGLLGMTADGINTTVVNLRDLIGQVVGMVDAISQAAQEISSGNQDLALRTSEQAASLEKASSSINQLNQAVSENSAHASEVNGLVKDSASIAEKGGADVHASVETMAGISSSAQKIGDIIGVIDAIAFQTNILALNAAVEAARAGEQGRGFAVVATEVRALAQRSAQAAKEIKTLITSSLDTIDAGAKQINRTGTTMSEIVTSINRVTQIMAGIADASAEQTRGIGNVNHMAQRLDEMTQQNAALVEEMAAAAESLRNQARSLQNELGKFKLPEAEALPRLVSSNGPAQLAGPGKRQGQRPPLRLSAM